MKPILLVVEDDEKMRRLLELTLLQEGYQVDTARHGKEALEKLHEQAQRGGYHLVLTDLQMPGMTGLELLERVQEIHPGVPVLILTAYGTVRTAVEAMKKGAFDYITKPVDHEELKCLIQRALELERLYRQQERLVQGMREHFGLDRIIGQSEAIQQVKRLVMEVAETDYTVLITGESGTGKELVAKAIHYSGRRCRSPWVAINCAAIPENLLESELFGYEKGAFTDARSSKPGKLRVADGGTVFLDEVAEMSMTLQAKLLRTLQEKEIEPLGSTRPVKVDIRVVAATNQDLFELVKAKRFREDLYYRINVFPIAIPPLRERRQDIPPLLDHFVQRYNRELGKKIRGFSNEALEILEGYAWPGNVRELQNLVERMMIVCKGDWVQARDLPPGVFQDDRPAATGSPLGRNGLLTLGLSIEELEEHLIREALESTQGNVTEAARLLKTTRNTLRYRIQKYGLNPPKGTPGDG